jgi:hypothetical protein
LADTQFEHLERQNQHGIKFRVVLSNAALEVERLLRHGVEFDIVVDDPQTPPTGYDELIFAQADGKLRIERQAQTTEFRDQPRPVERPDLGPGPRLRIEVIKPKDGSSDPIRFRAVGHLGRCLRSSRHRLPDDLFAGVVIGIAILGVAINSSPGNP